MSDSVERSRTPLLTLITSEALEQDYQVAASRRAGDPGEQRSGRAAVIFVAAAFAMLVTVAAVQTAANADVADASRTSLVERIEARRALVSGLQGDIADLREDNATAQRRYQSLGSQYADERARLSTLNSLTGFGGVIGDGVRIIFDNPPNATEDTMIRDTDLALLADALWAAGAEAVSINGQRVTAMSAIRTSGLAIEVNSHGIAPPYTVLAIGDRQTLAANFVETSVGLRFIGLAEQWGYSFTMDNDRGLRLPAAPASMRVLRWVTDDTTSNTGGGTLP